MTTERYCGIEIGDTVKDRYFPHIKGCVVGRSPIDNNRVYVEVIKGEKPVPCVAEYLDKIDYLLEH